MPLLHPVEQGFSASLDHGDGRQRDTFDPGTELVHVQCGLHAGFLRIEQIVDEAEQLIPGRMNLPQVRKALRKIPLFQIFDQHFAVPDDSHDGRAQIVTHP